MHVLISKLIVVVAAKCHKGFHWGGGGVQESQGHSPTHTKGICIIRQL